MRPDSYMPFDGNAFFQAVEGKDEVTALAYLRAIWHYWHHLHCQGLNDNREELRRICRVDKLEWDAVKATLFDNDKFFVQDENGLWRSKRADELWATAEANYKTNKERASKAAKVMWANYRRRLS